MKFPKRIISIVVLGLVLLTSGLLFYPPENPIKDDIQVNYEEEHEVVISEILNQYENEEEFLKQEEGPEDYPRPRTISVFTLRRTFIQGEPVDIFIRNNRNVELLGFTGGSYYMIVSVRTRDILFSTPVLHACGTMDPHQLDHHVWDQESDNGEQVPGVSYLIIGGFADYYDVAMIHIIGSPR